MKHSYINTYSHFLNETLKTHDIDLTINNVNTELSLLRYNFGIIKNSNNTISITLYNFNHLLGPSLYIDNLNRLLIDRHGWFPSKMIIINTSGMKNIYSYDYEILIDNFEFTQSVEITYESKYDIEVNIPDKVYHLSIQEYQDDILKKGLIPKSKSKLSKHLDRVFLCTDIKDCYNLIPRMKLNYMSNKLTKLKNKINDKWVIYEILTKDLNIKLYKDPNYNDGYHTTDNIKIENIRIIDNE